MDSGKRVILLGAILVGLFGLSHCSLAGGFVVGVEAVQPWEVWYDLASLARLDIGDQLLLRSSFCPDGCRYDRHSADDSRFVRVLGDEGVIFEDSGPGAVTRIWMTMGDGVSTELDPSISLRITLDDMATPAVEMSLPEFFSGLTAPFLAPMVGNRDVSSGGNFCLVPISYEKSCRISLIGAEEKKIWYQVNSHRLESASGVTTFTGTEDLSAWSELLSEPGKDPWSEAPGVSITESLTLSPGQTAGPTLLEGPDFLTAVEIMTPRENWSRLRLKLTFDEVTTVDLLLSDFFAVGMAEHTPTRSALIGAAGDGLLYSYFPKPYFRSALIELSLPAEVGGEAADVEYRIRRAARLPTADSGIFGVQLTSHDRTTAGRDTVVLDLEGQGKWVGLYAEIGSVDGEDRQYLEGDERVYIDGSPHPTLYGTGVEDFFSGGFYFRDQNLNSVPFRLALHGLTHDTAVGSDTVMGMYRLMLSDAPVFTSRIRAGIEGGPTNLRQVRLRTVAYFYLRGRKAMGPKDSLDVGNDESRVAHSFLPPQDCDFRELDTSFEGEPPISEIRTGCYRGSGASRFSLSGFLPGQHWRLRRLYDAGSADQRFAVVSDESRLELGAFSWANEARRWRLTEVFLERVREPVDGKLDLTLQATSLQPEFSEFAYELWAGFPTGACDVDLSGGCGAGDLADLVQRLADLSYDPLGDADANADGVVTVADLSFTIANVFEY